MKRWVWAMFAVELCAQNARAHAQSEDALSGVLKIQSQAAPCLTETALRERVRHWLAPHAAASGVTVVVDAAADPPAFRVLRGGAVIALRRFALLPSACADRLDAIALPVALAIEQATDARGAPGSTAATNAGQATSAPAGAQDAISPPAQSEAATPNAATDATATGANAAGSATPDAARTGAAANATATPAPNEAVKADAGARADANAEAEAEANADRAAEAEESAAEASPTGDAGSRATGADIASRWRLFAAGSLLFEALPHTVVAVEAGPELQLSQHLSVSLGALVTAQTDHTLGSVQSHAQVFGGRALLCAGWPVGGFGFDACAGAIGGAVPVSTSGTDTRQTLAWVAGMARAALRYPAQGAISVRLGLSGLLNAVRPRLLASGAVPRAAAAGVVGAETSLELLIALP